MDSMFPIAAWVVEQPLLSACPCGVHQRLGIGNRALAAQEWCNLRIRQRSQITARLAVDDHCVIYDADAVAVIRIRLSMDQA